MRCRRTMRELALALAMLSLADPFAARAAPEIPASVAAAIEQVTSKPKYAHSSWGFRVLDLATGEVLLDDAGSRMFIPGSIMKVYSTSTALQAYGPDHRFRTPVYRLGRVTEGVLGGHLVLVAAGDFSFGLRERPDGTLAYNSFPEIDHNYADIGAPGAALVPNSHPLAALDELAGQVRAAGIRQVRGNVVIDDRLFDTYRDWPDGLIAPIWVNENVIDITTTPTSVGKRATVDWRPKTAAVGVVSEVTTVAGDAKPLTIDSPRPGIVRIRGEIAANSAPVLRISPIPDPAAFARTAFIEALGRAGVRVSAQPTGANPSPLLPHDTSYPASQKIGEHVSPPFSQFIKVILKVSYNRGGDLMVCLTAARAGSRDCKVGIGQEIDLITRHGVSRDSTVVFDGAGSVDDGRTSPADATTFLRSITDESWGSSIRGGMAILGVDGTQATNGVGTPAAGRVQLKDGSRVAAGPGGYQGIILAKTLIGYIEAASGRQLTFAAFLNDAPFLSFDDFTAADHDVAAIAVALQGGY
jgi:PBP4 family serine-type D-alanyl-D-alanine carboxypeptidase